MDEKKYHEFLIDGCVYIPDGITENEFYDSFIRWVEANGWTFGGGINPYVEEKL